MRTVTKLALGCGINAAMEVMRTWLPLVLLLTAVGVWQGAHETSTTSNATVFTAYAGMIVIALVCSILGALAGVWTGHDPDKAGSTGAHIGAVVGLAIGVVTVIG